MLQGSSLQAVEDATEDADAGACQLQRGQRPCVEAEGLDADDEELVGVGHHQETGGSNEALCPYSGVTERHANDTGQEDVQESPGIQCSVGAGKLSHLPVKDDKYADGQEPAKVVDEDQGWFGDVHRLLILRQEQPLQQAVCHGHDAVQQHPANTSQVLLWKLGRVHACAGQHDEDAEEHGSTEPHGLRVEALHSQGNQRRGVPHNDYQRHGPALQSQYGSHQHSTVERNYAEPSAQIPEAADMD